MNSKPLQFVGVKMPASDKRRLFRLARMKGTSASALVRQALLDLTSKVD